MNDGKSRILGRHKAANLCHHLQGSNHPGVGTLPTHVAAGDDLKPMLLVGIDVIRDKPLGVQLRKVSSASTVQHLYSSYSLTDWMTCRLER